MGLDMNLYKKHYVQNWEHTPKEKRYSISIKQDGKAVKSINIKRIAYIEEDIGYWRKANQIHKWFIDNCANGDGDRREMFVSSENIKELYNLCLEVKAKAKLVDGKIKNGETGGKNADGKFVWIPNMQDGKIIENEEEIAELLPTESGFFFGSTDYDEYYMQDIDNTIAILKPEIEDIEKQGFIEYTYVASW